MDGRDGGPGVREQVGGRKVGRSGLWTIRRLRVAMGERGTMLLVSVVVGTGAGFGAVFFRWLIARTQALAWPPAESPLAAFSAAPWYWRVLVPAAGGLVVGLVVRYFAPEAKGHGVPEVMYAVSLKGGVIRPVAALGKALASAINIGTGGSIGREGPIVQIGSGIGSNLGRLLQLSSRQIRTAVGCGAAAGIAATFNAPIAGAFFAGEIILGGFEFGSFGFVVLASVVATVISRTLQGDIRSFDIPAYALRSPAEILLYAILGLLAGVVGAAFVRVLSLLEDVADAMKRIPDVLKPALGGLAIGLIAVVLPQVMGVGYESITDIIHLRYGILWLMVLLAAKIAATSITLGSGGSGGVFAPSLFMGAALGSALGQAAVRVAPFTVADPGAYAVVGMGAVVAATTHAPITAIMIIFEMTNDYRVIVGLMVSCILGTLFAQKIQKESIYTEKLARRGIELHAGREFNVLRRLHVHSVMRPEIDLVPAGASLQQLYRQMAASSHYEFFVAEDDGALAGVISVDDLRRLVPELETLSQLVVAQDLMLPLQIYLHEDDTLEVAMRQFGKGIYEELPVLEAGPSGRPVGTVRRQDVIQAYNRETAKEDMSGVLSGSIVSARRFRSWETIGGYMVAETEVPPHLCGPTLEELKLRQEEGLVVLLVERAEPKDGARFVLPTGETRLAWGDRLIVFGKRENVLEVTRTDG